ncbi:MAG: hypothetical protein GKR96_14780 [Gammaproteobacteria bacterium]|nr:hypothetical protein [Gammaproteobacteria bacterium]
MASRRKFLSLVGGGVVVAAGASAAGFALTRTPKKALAPWQHPGASYGDARKRFLSYAILAPNPHNQQPWLVDLSHEGQIWLYVDHTRLLPHTDPYNRQITIGLGCFLELLVQAAAQDGYLAELSLFPRGQNNTVLNDAPIASIKVSKPEGITSDPLFESVLERRSVKKPFDTSKPVEASVLSELEAVNLNGVTVGSTNAQKMLAELKEISWQAHNIEMETPRTLQESIDVMRFGKQEIDANPDGIDLGGAFLESLMVLGMLDRRQMIVQPYVCNFGLV